MLFKNSYIICTNINDDLSVKPFFYDLCNFKHYMHCIKMVIMPLKKLPFIFFLFLNKHYHAFNMILLDIYELIIFYTINTAFILSSTDNSI